MTTLFSAALLGALVVRMFGVKDAAEAKFFFALTVIVAVTLAVLLCA